jgi:uncharacterized protein (DUF885 family)
MQTKVLVLATLASVSCATTQPRAPEGTADAKFESLAAKYLEDTLRTYPELATQLGDHRFDDRLNDYSLAAVQRQRDVSARYLNELAEIPPGNLSPVNRVDYRILRDRISYQLFRIDELKEHEWNPMIYNVSGSINALLVREFAPLQTRLRSVKGRLAGIPEVLAQARANLKNPPAIHTETAIAQNAGSIRLVLEELNAFLARAPELKEQIAPIQARAVASLRDYGRWLKEELLPQSKRDFRLGDEKFRVKLRYSLESDLTKEEILKRAEVDLAATQNAAYEIALPLYKSFFPDLAAPSPADRKQVIAKVLEKLADQHPTNETIVAAATEDLKQATSFVRSHNLMTVPSEPVKPIVMPEYRRGVAVAYCDSAGPLEKNGETFFAISPTPSNWPAKRVESFFREYNNYMVQELTVHEAMPGHYLQLAHSNRFKAPTKLRSLFHSGVFAEGWAVYAERVMAEAGYGGPAVRMQQLKMRMRTIINAILDAQIHTAGMTEQQAMSLMMNEGFQEEGEAAGKWRRAALSSTQLSTYYVGSIEMDDIRRAYEGKNPGKVDYKQMHDQMLSFGTPAPKYVREMMGL